MKTTKSLLLLPALLVMLTPLLQGMEIFENDRVYKLGIPLIDAETSIAHNTLLYLLACTKTPNSQLHKQFAHNKLNQIHEDLRTDEACAIKKIASDYNISNEELNQIMSAVDQAAKYQAQHISLPQKTTIQDPTFPSNIFPILEKNKIHPQGINLIDNPSPSENHVADTRNSNYRIERDINNNIKTMTFVSNPQMTIYPYFYTIPSHLQPATLIHEIAHLTQHHGIITNFLANAILHKNANLKLIDLINNPSLQNLITIHERDAELTPSIKDTDDSSIMRVKRAYIRYPDRLFLHHYKQLSQIDELHKLQAKVDNYQPTPYKTAAHIRDIQRSVDKNIKAATQLSAQLQMTKR